VSLIVVPHQLSLWTQSQHVLLGDDITYKLCECQQALEAGVHVADLGWVWKPDMQTHINIVNFNDRSQNAFNLTEM